MKKNNPLKHNIWLKGAALLLAVFLWFFVNFRTQAEISMEVEPVFKDVPEGLCIADTKPDAVLVVLRGNERFLARLKPADIKISPALPEPAPGRVFVPIGPDSVKLPPHMSVVSVEPAGVWVVAEKKERRTVNVNPLVVGAPAEGFVVDKVEVTPEKVVVECPSGALRGARSVSTEPVDISGAEKTVTEDVPIKKMDKGAVVTPREVQVKIKLRRAG